MERSLTRLAWAGAALAILCWPAAASAADKQEVRVINTAAEPVPVAVGNFPATQTVTGSVSISNLPATSGLTHLGRPPGEVVFLFGQLSAGDASSFSNINLLRVGPDGAVEALPEGATSYTPPAGKLLVVTDYGWNIYGAATTNANVTVSLRANNWQAQPGGYTTWPAVVSVAPADSDGTAGAVMHFTAGIIFRAPVNLTVAGPSARTSGPASMINSVQGYLIDEN